MQDETPSPAIAVLAESAPDGAHAPLPSSLGDSPSASETARKEESITQTRSADKSIPSRDTRTKHVAIQAYRAACARYPKRALYDEVIRVLGDTPDVVRLKRCYTEWVAHGYNPANIDWLREWYPKGVPENGYGLQKGADAKDPAATGGWKSTWQS